MSPRRALFLNAKFLVIVLTGLSLFGVRPATAAEQKIVLTEYLGYGWASTLIHRPLNPRQGLFFPGRIALYSDAGKLKVPSQLTNIKVYPNGSIQSADLWFRTDLPAHGTREFVLRSVSVRKAIDATDLHLNRQGDVWEIDNAKTAVRLPAGEWNAPAGADAATVAATLAKRFGAEPQGADLPGPLLGVRLVSGLWAAASRVMSDDPGAKFLGYSTQIVDDGPIQVCARVTYRFSSGEYGMDITLRQGDPYIRVDEHYEKCGALKVDFGVNLEPSKFATKLNYAGDMQVTPIDYTRPNNVIDLVGWDFYLPSCSSVVGLLGGPRDDMLSWISPDPDWLPTPYNQSFKLGADKGGELRAVGSLASGHRHWGLLVGKGADFPDGGHDLYRWYTKNVFVPLDKVVNWQLVWPGMDDIEFPHTFFSKADLPGIRTRLQAEPAIKSYMENLRDKGAYWGAIPGDWNQAEKDLYKKYEAEYRARGGIFKGVSYVSASALYFDDPVYLDQLNDRLGFDYQRTPSDYLDFFIKSYLDGIGELDADKQMGSMTVSDDLLQRYIGTELLLGSGRLSAQEKHQFLIKLAFVTYVMHESEWQPPIHMADGSRPEGYGQGTPNQKDCALTARAIMACMLTGHPMQKEWMKFAMAEVRAHYPWTINESGALLESPFYSSRDTMRYAPFWSAMTRAGVADVAPDYKQWMDRPKKAFEYLANMLTPKEPRMGGRRVYWPIGRSSPGVIDPTFMIGGDPWGLDDPAHAALMRWAWEQQGKPSPDVMGTTGGRDLSQTLLAFSHPAPDLKENPLHSRRLAGMGAVLRSNPESDYESNILWRHDGFCWDLYAVNNGAVYFYGKGAPLLPRFGAYWSEEYGGAWMMELPFGNRVEFASGNNNCFGSTTEFASLGNLADIVGGITDAGDWKRRVLFSKDLDHDDPVYLLVRDDVSRPDTASSLNWWVMTSDVAPDGLKKPGVVPIKITDADWIKNMGQNWKDAPKITGQLHRFSGMTGVDLDMFIAAPADPQILTDAASAGQFPYCAGGNDLFETQELVRISQPAGKGYLTLLAPRWPDGPKPDYRTIADGAGVAITQPMGEDRLFLSNQVVSYKDDAVDFAGRTGFARHGAKGTLRLMIENGSIAADGFQLSCAGSAAFIFADGKIRVFYSGDHNGVKLVCPEATKNLPVTYILTDSFTKQ